VKKNDFVIPYTVSVGPPISIESAMSQLTAQGNGFHGAVDEMKARSGALSARARSIFWENLSNQIRSMENICRKFPGRMGFGIGE